MVRGTGERPNHKAQGPAHLRPPILYWIERYSTLALARRKHTAKIAFRWSVWREVARVGACTCCWCFVTVLRLKSQIGNSRMRATHFFGRTGWGSVSRPKVLEVHGTKKKYWAALGVMSTPCIFKIIKWTDLISSSSEPTWFLLGQMRNQLRRNQREIRHFFLASTDVHLCFTLNFLDTQGQMYRALDFILSNKGTTHAQPHSFYLMANILL